MKETKMRKITAVVTTSQVVEIEVPEFENYSDSECSFIKEKLIAVAMSDINNSIKQITHIGM